jgi:hypothetical protein
MATKLHELLAVERNLKAQATKVRTDLMSTFKSKTHHFEEKTVSYKPFGENEPAIVESQLDLQTTVPKELKWISEFLIKALDVSYQVAEANVVARANVVLEDGKTLLVDVPATALLELEKRAQELHDFVSAIPTLDPAKGFRPDPDKGADVFQARLDTQKRTKKIQKPLVLHPGNDKIAAQVQLVTEDVVVGEITKLEWSGLITVAAKGDMLSRVEMFTRAVKQARARANATEVNKPDKLFGAEIIKYVFAI